MKVTPRDLIRRRIKEEINQVYQDEHVTQDQLMRILQLFLDLDEESQKPPMISINPTTPNPPWQPYMPSIPSWPDSGGGTTFPWWDPRNPYKVTMTTDASTLPTTYSMTLESSSPYDDEDGEDGEEGEEGEPVPA